MVPGATSAPNQDIDERIVQVLYANRSIRGAENGEEHNGAVPNHFANLPAETAPEVLTLLDTERLVDSLHRPLETHDAHECPI